MHKYLVAGATALVLGFAVSAAMADQGTIANVHLGIGSQGGTATGGCVAFDLVRADHTVQRYGIGASQPAGPLYQEGILTGKGQLAGLDPQGAMNCGGGLPTFDNLNFPPKDGQ